MPNAIPFVKISSSDKQLKYLAQAMKNGHISGDGPFSRLCENWLEEYLNSPKALLTTSCTDALEMAAILCEFENEDEVILPSYTFVSTANAFIMHGAKPVFVDIHPLTKNIDPKEIEKSITAKTKAIVVVHYAGVLCDMAAIQAIANRYNLLLIEDAAQALRTDTKYGKAGTFGDLACFSFHQTKNIYCGEGGALIVNNHKFIDRAEIIREKGTNRKQFINGEVDKYGWCDIGSSFLPSELNAAYLLSKLEVSEKITKCRTDAWSVYFRAFEYLMHEKNIKLPSAELITGHNAHIFYLELASKSKRDLFIEMMKDRGVSCAFHYIPLHDTKFGRSLGAHSGEMRVTKTFSENMVRLPLWEGIEEFQSQVISTAIEVLDAVNLRSTAEG